VRIFSITGFSRIAAKIFSSPPQFGQCSRRAQRSLKHWPQGLPERWAGDLRRRIAAVELDMAYAKQRALFELAPWRPSRARWRRALWHGRASHAIWNCSAPLSRPPSSSASMS
jgi:hypothetical protein